MKRIHVGPDGRKWHRKGPSFWHCYEDGTVIQSIDEILPNGETSAEANFKKFIAGELDRIVYKTGTIDKGSLNELLKDKS